MVPRLAAATAIAVVIVLAGCGQQQNSYDDVERALRVWLEAIARGDQAACDLMTREYRREFVEEAGAGDRSASCEHYVRDVVSSGTGLDLPAADSSMEVPAWDPSGEALVEVNDQVAGHEVEYWMQFSGGRWLVAGVARGA